MPDWATRDPVSKICFKPIKKKSQTIPRQFSNILNLQIDLYTKLCYKAHSQANNLRGEENWAHLYVTGQTFVLLFLDLGLYFLADLCFCFGFVRTYSGSHFWFFILGPHGKWVWIRRSNYGHTCTCLRLLCLTNMLRWTATHKAFQPPPRHPTFISTDALETPEAADPSQPSCWLQKCWFCASLPNYCWLVGFVYYFTF